ncbi:MAG: phosphoribosylglycinamide formyltransferase [Planctomycetales bacterium]
MTSRADEPFSVVVLISGGGTTLANLLDKINDGLPVRVKQVISSNPQAKGIQFAEQAGIPHSVIERRSYPDVAAFSEELFRVCRDAEIDMAVMGGFLKRVVIPADFRNRVLNIHPSLIPSFCGQGFYGSRVHQAALDYGVKVSGCTVHFVDDEYDHGPILLQRTVPVHDGDDAETLAARVFAAERDAYPEALRLCAEGRVECDGRRVVIRPAGD